MTNTSTNTSWFSLKNNQLTLHLFIQPKASKSQIIGIHGDRLKIKIAAPPVDGAANDELLQFIKKTFRITLQNIEIVRGETGRQKDICICQLEPKRLEEIVHLINLAITKNSE